MSMSVPGNSCRPCSRTTTSTGCTVRVSGECAYYSGSAITGPGINPGDTLNTVINKLANYTPAGGGTVTSVAASIPSGAIAIAGSPITTSGTLAFTYTGDSSQYIQGDGSLATFPSVPTITADNGLSINPANNVQLGGTLIQNTFINTDSFATNWTGSHGQNGTIIVTNTGSGGAFYGNATGGGVTAVFDATEGNSSFYEIDVLQLRRSTNGAPANGIGTAVAFFTETTTSLPVSNRIVSRWVDVTHATRFSQLSISGVNGSSSGDILTLNGDKSVQANGYGLGTFSGTAAYTLQVDSAGNVIEGTVAPSVGASVIPFTSANFDPDGITVTDASLNGRTFELFLNDLNRFIYNEVGNQEWDYVIGGGFQILIPGFDASTIDYHLYLFPKT
jgi:hypothetical protein